MGLTIQQLFDYIEGLNEDKPGIILKGIKEEKNIYYKIHLANDKYYIDSLKDIDIKKDIDDREVLDKEELQMFKVKIMGILKSMKVEDIYLE